MKEQLQFLMEGGSVVRYHARPGIKPDTDAHHSHGVAVLCSLLAPPDEEGRTTASAMLLMAALTHDLGEQAASDMSAPAKRALGISEQLHDFEAGILTQYGFYYAQYLDATERAVLKLADCFDGMLYCCRELALGNRSVLLIWRRWCTYVEALAVDVPLDVALRASLMYEAIKDIYREVTSVSGPEFDVFSKL